METGFLYEDDVEQGLHESAIERLSRDLRRPEPGIRTAYETVLSRLKEEARIKDYLVVLVTRNVKDMMREFQ